MNAPLVFELEYYGPSLLRGPGAVPVLSKPTGPPNVSYEAFSPGQPPPNLPWLSLWVGNFFFQNQC